MIQTLKICNKSTAYIILCIMSFALQACSTLPDSESPCIKASVISDLSRAPIFPVFENDPRVATLSMEKIICQAKEENKDGKNQALINLVLDIPEARKATGRIKKAQFPIFVALLDRDENVLDRHDENIEVIVDDKLLKYKHNITYQLPDHVYLDGKGFQLFLGFNGKVTSALPLKTSHSLQSTTRKKNYKHSKKRKLAVQR